jgi:MFS-type transporter involved in bile tolerance (Atg22 family)
MTQFAAQASYLILITAISIGIGLSTVVTAQMSQGINVVWITLAFIVSWRMMPHIPASHELPEGSRLFTAGFVQVYHTAVNIFKEYRSSLWWYFWAVVFAEAGANAFTVMAVIYLSDQIGMNGTEVGIFFLVSLIGTIPGGRLGAFVTRRLNPKRSWQLALAIISVVTIVGALTLNQDVKNVSYVWGFFIGLMLGWHYPTEGLIFSMCLPKGQDTELCGFYVYCTQILVWLPPLIFSALVNNGVSQNYGTITIVFFFIVAVVLINMLPSWPEVLADVRKHDVEDGYEVHDEPAKGGVPDANGRETVDAGETSEPKA